MNMCIGASRWVRNIGLAALAGAVLAGQAVASEPVIKTLEANGYEFTYAEQGSGPLMVIAHGAMSDHRAWHRQMRILASDFRVVALTQRYYGKGGATREGPSLTEDMQADDLAAFVKALKSGPAHLVGHSMGGRTAHYASLRHPSIARTVYLYEGAVRLPQPAKLSDDRKRMFGLFRKAWAPVSEAVKAKDYDTAGKLLIANVSGDKTYYERSSDEDKKRWQENSAGFGRYYVRKQTAKLPCEEMARSNVPTVLAIGTKAEVAPGVPFSAIYKRHKDCLGKSGSILTIQDATHMWPYMDPEAFVNSVRSFAMKH